MVGRRGLARPLQLWQQSRDFKALRAQICHKIARRRINTYTVSKDCAFARKWVGPQPFQVTPDFEFSEGNVDPTVAGELAPTPDRLGAGRRGSRRPTISRRTGPSRPRRAGPLLRRPSRPARAPAESEGRTRRALSSSTGAARSRSASREKPSTWRTRSSRLSHIRQIVIAFDVGPGFAALSHASCGRSFLKYPPRGDNISLARGRIEGLQNQGVRAVLASCGR